MSLDRNLNMYSLNDVLGALKEYQEPDGVPDEVLAFASNLTGISEDALWSMVNETERGVIV